MKYALSPFLIAIFMLTGCASVPAERKQNQCGNCGEITGFSEARHDHRRHSTGFGMGGSSAAIPRSIGGQASTGGLLQSNTSFSANSQASARHGERSIRVAIRMSVGNLETISIPRSQAARWAIGDKVKVIGNSFIRQ